MITRTGGSFQEIGSHKDKDQEDEEDKDQEP